MAVNQESATRQAAAHRDLCAAGTAVQAAKRGPLWLVLRSKPLNHPCGVMLVIPSWAKDGLP